MALNSWAKSKQAIIDARRRKVAELKLRGLTLREIEERLADPENGMLNPDTGQPYSLGTISSDMKALTDEWKAAAAADISEHIARQMAELQEVKRAAWARGDLEVVRKCLADEAKLLGTQAPSKSEIMGKDGGKIEIESGSLSIERQMEGIMALYEQLAETILSPTADGESGVDAE